jgi:hypothetical protein
VRQARQKGMGTVLEIWHTHSQVEVLAMIILHFRLRVQATFESSLASILC